MTALQKRFGEELFECCATDDETLFREWVQRNKCDDWTALLEASTYSDAANIARHCLQQGAKPSLFVLSSMAICGAEKVHRVLVEEFGLDVNESIEIWKSALAAAVRKDNLSWVQFCLDKGADPNRSQLDDYRFLLAEAAGNGSIPIMRLLLDHGAKRQDSGALIWAAEQGKAESIRFLLDEEGFDINEIGIEEPTDSRSLEDVGTALHKAIEVHPELVDLLLGTDMSLRDGQGRTPLELARQLGRFEVLGKLGG
jgi:ankyrin repeat protein